MEWLPEGCLAGYDYALQHFTDIVESRVCMKEKPTIALVLMAGWAFWFLFFLYLGV